MSSTTSAGRAAAAEAIGTAFLLMAIVGSGIMAERLAGGNVALALLANTLTTGAALLCLILALGPVSGAHLNPAVTLAVGVGPDRAAGRTLAFVGAQVAGALAGVALAHLMFEMPALYAVSAHARGGWGQGLSEGVATFGLVLVIGSSRHAHQFTAFAVAAYISAACWFTASTSFANPAVTVARALTDTFTGIRPVDVPAFVGAQLAGGLAGGAVSRWLNR